MPKVVQVIMLCGAAIWAIDIVRALITKASLSGTLWYVGFVFVAFAGVIELVWWLRVRSRSCPDDTR
ncbi:hypothetical protein [uncultured Tessaracoccus sp.]|uniref:hypothetical protein n=1 Tax=uncultured Tessaracoccus sp. TaxID=905023 RepID=UPI002616599A|nr:hypothetical protein [uncultured Tessaracoccus sp.]